MGSDNNGGQFYDLRRIEDVFACLEIISIARGALFSVDPDLAKQMARVSDALGAFSQLVMEGGLADMEDEPEEEPAVKVEKVKTAAEAPPVSPIDEVPDNVFADLTVNGQATPAAPQARQIPQAAARQTDAEDEEEGIIDILTGERIK